MSKLNFKINRLNFTDVLLILSCVIVFGLIYKFVSVPREFLRPFGFHVDRLVYGLWFIGGTFCMLLIRKPGAGLLADAGASLLESLLGGGGGLVSFYYGLNQGIGLEIGYALYKYERFDLKVTLIAVSFCTVGSLITTYMLGHLALEPWALSLIIPFTFISGWFFAGWMMHFIYDILVKSGVIKSRDISAQQQIIDKL